MVLWVVGLNFVLGKDLNWDFLNYHYYGPYLLLQNRFEQDYFAASLQSYLNPLAHVPHYLMIRAGWNSLLIGVVLAVAHSLNLYFVWRIAADVMPAHAARGFAGPALAVVLALLAPLFITTAGSSFADPTTSVILLAGMWLLLRESLNTATSARNLLASGLLMGLAGGLKMTNGVLAVACVLPVAAYWLWARPAGWATRIAMVAGTLALGVLIGHGYWSWKLWQTFGNPLFPLLNQIFQSPDFPAVAFRDTRFLGDGWRGLLTLPFHMIAPLAWLYAENIVVDLRPLALIALLLAAIPVLVFRRSRRAVADAADGVVPGRLLMLTAMVLLSYVMWGLSTKIGRYALPVWLMLGPLFVAWLSVLIRRQDIVVTIAGVLIAAQAWAMQNFDSPRWAPTRWEDRWLKVRVPDDLARKPLTLLTLGKQSYAAFVPFVHPGSRVTNLAGQYVLPAGDSEPARLKQLLSTPVDDMRVVFVEASMSETYTPKLTPAAHEDADAVLSSYGLRLAAGRCEPIEISIPYLQTEAQAAARKADNRAPLRKFDRLNVCPLDRLPAADMVALNAERQRINRAFDAVERACGSALSPHGGEALHGKHGWMRTYFNSLNSVITNGETMFARPFYNMVDVDLGSFEDWTRGTTPTCPLIPAAIGRPQ